MEKVHNNKAKQESNSSKDTIELQRELGLVNEESSKLHQQLEELRKSEESKSAELETAYAEIQKLQVSVRIAHEQENKIKSNHKEEVDAYKNVNFDLEKLLTSKSEEIKDLQNSLKHLKEKAITNIKEKERENKRLRDSLQQTKIDKENVTKELSETKSRLSKLMGDKLSNNNPDIADLSDENRPTKLAEKYQELYDNQWTDAFEKAEVFFSKESEKTRITVLLKILKDVYQFCKDEVAEQEKDFVKAMFRTNETKELSSTIPASMRTHLKELERYAVSGAIKYLSEKYHQNCDKTNQIGKFNEHIREFVHECITLCWHMVHQNPQVVLHLDVHSGNKFDGSMYKQYTMTGAVVDFVVWPALLLCENGSVLSKGVVQCVKLSQGSQSLRVRSKKVDALEMGVTTGSVRSPNPTTQLDVKNLSRGKVAKDKTLTQSDLNRNHGKSLKSNQTPRQEMAHSKVSVSTDCNVKLKQDEQLHHNHAFSDESAQVHHPKSSVNFSEDSQITDKSFNSSQPIVDGRSQPLFENNHQDEAAVNYVQQFRGHEDRLQQSQMDTAYLPQNKSNVGDVIHTQPNSYNFHTNYPHNANVPHTQPYSGTFHPDQQNVSIPQQQNINSSQSGTGVGQISYVQSSTSAAYANQHQNMWTHDYISVQDYNTFLYLHRYYGNSEQVRMHMGTELYQKCMNYYSWAISSYNNQK